MNGDCYALMTAFALLSQTQTNRRFQPGNTRHTMFPSIFPSMRAILVVIHIYMLFYYVLRILSHNLLWSLDNHAFAICKWNIAWRENYMLRPQLPGVIHTLCHDTNTWDSVILVDKILQIRKSLSTTYPYMSTWMLVTSVRCRQQFAYDFQWEINRDGCCEYCRLRWRDYSIHVAHSHIPRCIISSTEFYLGRL